VRVAVNVAVAVLLGVTVGVFVGVSDGVFVGVFVGVLVGVLVGVFVGVFVGVLVGVFVGVLVGSGGPGLLSNFPVEPTTELAIHPGGFMPSVSIRKPAVPMSNPSPAKVLLYATTNA